MTSRLVLLAGVFTLGFLVITLTSFVTIESVKVNGPHYQNVIANKDLLADVLPPPCYVVETYLRVLRLGRGPGDPDEEHFLNDFAQLKKEYAERQSYWAANLRPGPLKDEINEGSRIPAEAFFEVIDREIVPAVRRKDYGAVNGVIDAKLTPLFKAHRASVNRIVDMTTENAKANEAAVASMVRTRLTAMTVLGLMLMVTIGSFTLWMRQTALQGEASERERASELAALRASMAVVDFAPDGTIESANEPFLALLGYRPDEIRGRPHRQLLDATEADGPTYQNFWPLLGLGERLTGEFSLRRKDGRVARVVANYNPITDNDGTVVRVVACATDISEHVRPRGSEPAIRSDSIRRVFGMA
jgi:methyl-accepting chemotaxis protein